MDRNITYVGFVGIQRSREHRVTITTVWISIEINRVYRFDNRNERNEYMRERLLSRMSVCRKCAHAVPGRRRKNELEREYEELWNEAEASVNPIDMAFNAKKATPLLTLSLDMAIL